MHKCPRTLGEHGCAECLRNRTYDKRVKVHRLHLESMLHEHSVFLTLTYDDEHLPDNGSLVRSHYVDFLKRLRYYLHPRRFRYFLVGEYGDVSQRPHYHAILFGVSSQDEDAIRSSWKMGHIMLGEVNIKTLRYVAGYVTKKMTASDDSRLDGRIPEFAKGSTQPGLGYGFINRLISTLDFDAKQQLINEDVPKVLYVSGRPLPLGRYMLHKLRVAIHGDRYAQDEELSTRRIKKRISSLDENLQNVQKDYESSSMSKKMTRVEFQKVNQKAKFRDLEANFIIKQFKKEKL